MIVCPRHFSILFQVFLSLQTDEILAETVVGLVDVAFVLCDGVGRVPLAPDPPGLLCWRVHNPEVWMSFRSAERHSGRKRSRDDQWEGDAVCLFVTVRQWPRSAVHSLSGSRPLLCADWARRTCSHRDAQAPSEGAAARSIARLYSLDVS